MFPHSLRLSYVAALIALLGLSSSYTPALAQISSSPKTFTIPAGSLAEALHTYARQQQIHLSFAPELVAGKQNQAFTSTGDIKQDLQRMLTGSQLSAHLLNNNSFVLRQSSTSAVQELDAVQVQARLHFAPPDLFDGNMVADGSRLGLLGDRSIMDTPFNTTAYTAEMMEARQAHTLAGALQYDPSIRFSTPSGHVYENYTLRGQTIHSSDLAIHGLYGLAPDGHSASEYLERVEVLRGPGAMLSGMSPSGGVGGVINLSPKQARQDPLTRLNLDYTSKSQLGAHIDISRRFGSQQQFGLRLNGVTRDGNTDVDHQSKKRQLLAINLDYQGERVRANLFAYTNKERSENGSPMMVGLTRLNAYVDPPQNTINILPGIHAHQSSDAVLLRTEFELNDQWSTYLSSGWGRSDYTGFLNGTRGLIINEQGDYLGQTFQQRGGRRTWSAETGLRGNIETGWLKHELVLSLSRLKIHNRNRATTGPSYPSNIYHPLEPILVQRPAPPNKTGETELSSLAIADTISMLEDRLLLTAGARTQQVKSLSWNANTGAQTGDYDERALSPMVGIVIKPWGEQLSFYANAIEGLSQGGSVTDQGARNYGTTFAPIKSRQVEAGVKWDSGSMINTLSVYQLKRPSMIKQGSASDYWYTQEGEQRSRGIEWNVMGELAENLRLLGGAAYTKATHERSAGGTYDGNDIFGMPRLTANLGLEWDTPWINDLSFSARMVHTGKQYADNANRVKLPSWTRWDVGASYRHLLQNKPVVWHLNIENLLNRSYWEGTFNDGYATMNGPRSIKLTMGIEF